VHEIISIRLACAYAQEKKAGRQEGRSHKKCKFHVCVERPQAGGFQPNLANVFVSWTLSNEQSFIVIISFRRCEVLKFPYCHRELRLSLTLCYAASLLCATAQQVINILPYSAVTGRTFQVRAVSGFYRKSWAGNGRVSGKPARYFSSGGRMGRLLVNRTRIFNKIEILINS